MRMSRRQLAAMGASALAIRAGGAGRARAAEALKFMTLAGHNYMPPLFAMDQGLFTAEGVTVDVTISAAPPTVLPAVIGGSLQIGSTSAIQVATSHDAGLDILVLGPANTQFRAHPNTAVVLGSKSGIKTPADFAGRKVVTPGVSGTFHVMFLKFLKSNNVDARKVQFLESGFAQMGDMVRGGTADAALTTEPFLSRMLDAGIGTRMEYFVSDRPYLFDSFFIVAGPWARAHHQELMAVKRGLRAAIAKMAAQPDLAAAVEAKYLKLPPAVIAREGAFEYIPDVTPADLQVWIDLSREMGMISHPVDAASLIAN